jgi:hypothetical protein
VVNIFIHLIYYLIIKIMMNNTINSGSLQGLQVGQTLLVSARKVAGNKVQLEFAEIVKTQSNAVNPLALFNQSDDRFSQGGARRAWLTAEPKDAGQYLGIDLTEANSNWTVDAMGREIISLNILNPMASIQGELIPLKVEIVETVTPTDWQAANLDTSAKRRGKDGAFITHKGMYIFANTRIAFHKANNVFLEADAAATTTQSSGIPAGVDFSTGEIFN